MKLKLSEAIMMNGMTKPQGFGPASMYSENEPCALGGALQVIGVPQDYGFAWDSWPWAFTGNYACPACSTERTWAASVITHLNDEHKWTRAQIAEWVATVEPPDDPLCALCSHPEGEHAAHGDWCPTPASEDQLFNYHQKFTSPALSQFEASTGAEPGKPAPVSKE